MSDDATASKSDAAKPATSEGSASETTATPKPAKSGSGGSGSRPISYFSSVSTDAYRAGWDSVFRGNAAPATAAKPAKARRTARSAAPLRLELEAADLDDDLRARLEQAFRRKAGGRRREFDRLTKAGRLEWRLSCEAES